MGARPKIAIFISFSGQGGVERMVLNLCQGLLDLGVDVDLLPVKLKSDHLAQMPQGLRVVDLHAAHTLSSLPALVRYLRRERPTALLAAKNRANQIAVLARRLAGVPTRVVLRMGTTTSAALTGKSALRTRWWSLGMRMTYPQADGIVAVSGGVAKDLAALTGLPPDRFTVIPNPVVTPRVLALAEEPADHPWIAEKREPVIIGVGRLTRQKDFPTLIRAFALARRRTPCRLIILGKGEDRPMLEAMARDLGVEADISLPGFAPNPYALVKRADLFVLSSIWEGSPNVLTEALALGVPSVATDCPSGPKEVLQNGRYGPLVPMGDAEAMAEAMLKTLADPPDRTALTEAVRDYAVEVSSRRYLALLLGDEGQEILRR